jgi:dienelactone hydrolase
MLFASVLASLMAQASGAAAPPPPAGQERSIERVVIEREKRPLVMELALVSDDPRTPMLVLYHRARSSRGEYRAIVPRLKELGYNCLSVDLSSGGACRDVPNLTVHDYGLRKAPTFLDALPDFEDSLRWAREHHASQGKVVAWGSVYSASLALHVAAAQPALVDGVIAFSPTECFGPLGKSETWVQESARNVSCPVFVTSARVEEGEWRAIFEAIPSPTKTSFLPSGAGTSGSPALWKESTSHAEYWAALAAFLAQHFPVPARVPEAPPTRDG